MTNYQLNRRTVLKTAAYASLFGGGLTPVARNVQARNVVTEKSTSFETESVGDTEPADPWSLFGDGGTHEVSDTRASDGDQSFYTAFAPLGEPSAIAITLDVTSIDTIKSDVYIENANQFSGSIKISKDSAGFPQDGEDNLSNFTPKQENTWHRDLETDISDIENEHTITFWVDGDNAAYWDNIRFISSATGTVIDDFESGELESAWYNAIDTSEFTQGDDFGRDAFTVQSDTAPEGDYAVRGDRTLQGQGFSTISRDDFSPIDSDGSSISLYARVGPVINGYERANKIEFNEQTDGEGNDKRKVAILIDQKDRTDPPDDQARIGNRNTPNSNLSTPKLIEIQDINFSKNKVGAVRVAGEEVATDLNFLNDVSQITSVHLMQGHFAQPADIVVDAISFTEPESEPSGPPPTAQFTVEAPIQRGSETVFDASASSITDGSISTYEFDFDGDGTFEASTDASSENATTFIHTYDTIGEKEVTLRVTADNGAQDTITQTIDVRLLRASNKEDLAAKIDEQSVFSDISGMPAEQISISDTSLVKETVTNLRTEIKNGTIGAGAAEEAIERLVAAEDETRKVIHRIGPAGSDTVTIDPVNEESKTVPVNLARAFAENLFTIAVRMALAISTAKLAINEVSGPIQKVSLEVNKGLTSDALEGLINNTIPFEQDIQSTLLGKTDSLAEQVVNGNISTLSAFETQVTQIVKDIVDQFAIPFRMAIHFAELDPTAALTSGILDGPGEPVYSNLKILHENLRADAVQAGLQGSTADAVDVAETLGINLIQTIESSFKSIETSNPLKPFDVELDFSPLSLLFEVLRGLATEGDPFAIEDGFDQFLDLLGVIVAIAAGLKGGILAGIAISVLQEGAGIVAGLPVLFTIQSAHEELVQSTIKGEETGELFSQLGGNEGNGVL